MNEWAVMRIVNYLVHNDLWWASAEARRVELLLENLDKGRIL